MRLDPPLFIGAFNNRNFNILDSNGRICDPQNARVFTRSRTHPAGKFWEIICFMQPFDRFFPPFLKDKVVPVGNNIAYRASLLAKGYPAVHTARALGLDRLRGHFFIKFPPMLETLTD